MSKFIVEVRADINFRKCEGVSVQEFVFRKPTVFRPYQGYNAEIAHSIAGHYIHEGFEVFIREVDKWSKDRKDVESLEK